MSMHGFLHRTRVVNCLGATVEDGNKIMQEETLGSFSAHTHTKLVLITASAHRGIIVSILWDCVLWPRVYLGLPCASVLHTLLVLDLRCRVCVYLCWAIGWLQPHRPVRVCLREPTYGKREKAEDSVKKKHNWNQLCKAIVGLKAFGMGFQEWHSKTGWTSGRVLVNDWHCNIKNSQPLKQLCISTQYGVNCKLVDRSYKQFWSKVKVGYRDRHCFMSVYQVIFFLMNLKVQLNFIELLTRLNMIEKP